MNENLPNNEIKFDKNVEVEDILNTPDDSNTGFFLEAALKYTDNIKEKTKKFPSPP